MRERERERERERRGIDIREWENSLNNVCLFIYLFYLFILSDT